jgi:hypothetical protein
MQWQTKMIRGMQDFREWHLTKERSECALYPKAATPILIQIRMRACAQIQTSYWVRGC